MKFTLIGSLVLLATLATAQTIDPVAQTEIDTNMADIQYYFAVARGFIIGYEEGFYMKTKYKINKLCLDQNTIDSIQYVVTAYVTSEYDYVRDFAYATEATFLIEEYCDFETAIYDVLRWCNNNQDCSPMYMVQSTLGKVFQVTTVANDLTQIMAQPQPDRTDLAAVQTYWVALGNDFGKLLRYALNFDPTLL